MSVFRMTEEQFAAVQNKHRKPRKAATAVMLKRRRLSTTEHQSQKALIEWVRLNEHKDRRLSLLFAIPNGRLRTAAEAGKLKAEGVKPGVPDLMLPCRGSYNELGLFIEMKTEGGSVGKAQHALHIDLVEQGYSVRICRSWLAAADAICDYLNGPIIRPDSGR